MTQIESGVYGKLGVFLNLMPDSCNMRTTLDLPEDLLHEAMQATDIKTKTKVITVALEELVRKSKISALKRYKGKVDLDIDLDKLRDR